MVQRATSFKATATIITRTMAASNTAVVGMPAKCGSDDVTWATCGAADDGFMGVFMNAATAGNPADVAIDGVVPVVVGTGGATRGSKGVAVADGFANAPAHNTAGSTNNVIAVVFVESGSAGDLVGAKILHGNRGSA